MRGLSYGARLTIAAGLVFSLGLAAMIAVPLLMVMGTVSVSNEPSTGAADCGPRAVVAGRSITLDASQLANAGTIVQTGRDLGVPARGLVVAVATALQESTLRNLDWGDHTSVGLFQQLNAWGSHAERTTPRISATMFYTGGRQGQPGLLDIAGWATMSITDAAQAVQASGFPLAYAKWETLARSLVQAEIGQDPLACRQDAIAATLPTGVLGNMLTVALEQQGKPYVWGSTGPDSFDCSGLVVYSWRQAGYLVRVRTAAQMWHNAQPVPLGQEEPGDLIFGQFEGNDPGHVMIIVDPGQHQAVQAPESGRNVELADYSDLGPTWRIGRLKPSVLTRLSSA